MQAPSVAWREFARQPYGFCFAKWVPIPSHQVPLRPPGAVDGVGGALKMYDPNKWIIKTAAIGRNLPQDPKFSCSAC